MDDLDKIISEKLSKLHYDDSELSREYLDAVYAAIPGDYNAIDYNELLTGVKNVEN